MTKKSQEQNTDIFNHLDLFLRKRGIDCADSAIFTFMEERKKCGSFDLSRHIKGLIYAQLTNQTKWANIEPKLYLVDKLFFDYDTSLIKQKNGEYFADGIFNLKCGNRLTKRQMANLHHNISILDHIEKTEGGIDKYYTTMPAHKLVKTISAYGGAYKLKYIGTALAWEYLGNVGIDRIKPDVHIRRMMGSNRLGYSRKPIATEDEVVSSAIEISSQTGLSLAMIDALLWSFCAEGRGNICVKTPNCNICPVSEYCNKNG
ncbi:MAG: hypothetical protein FWF85_07255 [Clostridiales bacterium]|nr:hypothetical protein [Clostridiales bacterium]